MPPGLRSRRGVTLVELMISVAFLSAVALATALTYTVTMRALTLSKSRGLAARLAQDRIESLRALDYALLLPTSQSDLNIAPGVDLTNYPPEKFMMGGKAYTRTVTVSKVYKDPAGAVVVLAPAASDTGLKQVTVNVTFPSGAAAVTKSYTALISDPNLVPLNGLLYGVVSDTMGVALAGARVFIEENQNWYAVSSSTGYYQIQMDTKSYTVDAALAGYFDYTAGLVTIGASGYQQNIQLTRRARGKISGQLALRPPAHLLISQVAGATSTLTGDGTQNVEYVELFNPTTYAINIGVTGGTKTWTLNYTDDTNPARTRADADFGWVHVTTYVAPASYYLYAGATWFYAAGAWLRADAHYDVLYANRLQGTDAGSLALQDQPRTATADRVGWNDSGTNASLFEGTAVPNPSGGNGIARGSELVRYSSAGFASASYGRASDTDDNSKDFLWSPGIPYRPFSMSDPSQPIALPASSATVAATDGLSAAVFASATGFFLIPDVTTGTWSVAAYWNTYTTVTARVVAVLAGQTTQQATLLLDAGSAGQGGIAGQARRADTLQPLSGVAIKAGAVSAQTDSSGAYILNVTSGSYSVVANEGYANQSYGTLKATVSVSASSITTGVNFVLNPCGLASGKVTTNGTDPYPNVIVHALFNGIEYASTLTDSGGNYTLQGVPVGSVVVAPAIDSQSQSSSPGSWNPSISQGATATGNDFTVTSAMGTISGSVKSGASAITSGVLVVASTTPLTGLPAVDNAYRTGSNVLYSATSDTQGSYRLSLVRNATYTLYGYYTTLAALGTNTVQVSSASVYISSANWTVNLQW